MDIIHVNIRWWALSFSQGGQMGCLAAAYCLLYVITLRHGGSALSSWLKSCKNYHGCNHVSDDLIILQFCTCHNSWALVACTKFVLDLIMHYISAKSNLCFYKNWIICELINLLWNGGPEHTYGLTHWGRDKMAAISQTTFSSAFFKFFFNENIWIPITISMKFVPKGPINNIPALVQIMAWRRPGDKPLSAPMVASLLTHICVTRPQWVNAIKT